MKGMYVCTHDGIWIAYGILLVKCTKAAQKFHPNLLSILSSLICCFLAFNSPNSRKCTHTSGPNLEGVDVENQETSAWSKTIKSTRVHVWHCGESSVDWSSWLIRLIMVHQLHPIFPSHLPIPWVIPLWKAVPSHAIPWCIPVHPGAIRLARAGPPGVMGTAEIIRLNVEAVATSPSRSTRLGATWSHAEPGGPVGRWGPAAAYFDPSYISGLCNKINKSDNQGYM